MDVYSPVSPPGYGTGDRWARPVGRVYMRETNDRSFDEVQLEGQTLQEQWQIGSPTIVSNFDEGDFAYDDEVLLEYFTKKYLHTYIYIHTSHLYIYIFIFIHTY